MPLWIPITIAAAFFQNLRSSLQKHLKGRMKTLGATFARFGFGFPFAIAYATLLNLSFGLEWPTPNATFVIAAVCGGAAQITATFLLVWLFSFRNFMVGTAYSKTEPIQAAAFGLIILHETIAPLGLVAILAGALGVVVISVASRPSGSNGLVRALMSREAGIGVLSGAFFGVSAVCYRWASLSLGGDGFLMQAAFTLAVVTTFQTAAMLAWMAWRDPGELRAVARAWKPSLVVGLVGVCGSAGWFTAMTLEKVAYVRALGQIELVFTFATSVLVFRERITRMEIVGCLLIVAAIFGVLGAAA